MKFNQIIYGTVFKCYKNGFSSSLDLFVQRTANGSPLPWFKYCFSTFFDPEYRFEN